VAARLAKLLSSGSQLDAAAGYRFDRIACKVSASTTCPRLANLRTAGRCWVCPASLIPRVSRRAPASDGKQWRMRKRKLPPRGGGDERRYHAFAQAQRSRPQR
jgi:hypothetical protein